MSHRVATRIVAPCRGCLQAAWGSARRLSSQTPRGSLGVSARPIGPIAPPQTQLRTLATLANTPVVPTASSVTGGPTRGYDEQVTTGMIQNDDHQRSIVALLQNMYDDLERYAPLPVPDPFAEQQPTFLSSWFKTAAPKVPIIDAAVPKGLYLYGSVGCGKSFLMDLFYANLPARFDDSKRRVHFHAFMMDVHQRGHRIKMELGDRADWIVPIARELAREARVLCFDEFQVKSRLLPGSAREADLCCI